MLPLLLIASSVCAVALVPWFAFMSLILGGAAWNQLAHSRLRTNQPEPTTFLIVIPAHDESSVITVTVQSCLAVQYPPDRFQVVVIADNCSDDTAELAQRAGAEVIVRVDPLRKSKGFALEDFFRGTIRNEQVRSATAYVLVDADTSIAPDLLEVFDQKIKSGADFIQGYYTVRNADVSWRTRLMTHAFSLANGVWLLGLDQIGLGVGLKGNGMCFRAGALERFPWQAHGLVEDMEFAWQLRVAGERVRFCPEARVFGEMVSRGGSGAGSQRLRWEKGRQSLRTVFGPKIWRAAAVSWPKKALYWLDLYFPPLSRLGVGLALASALTGVGIMVTGLDPRWTLTIALILAEWIILGLYGLSPVVLMQLPIRFLASGLYLPYYVLWKLTIGVLKQPQEWVRTPREAQSNEA